MNGRRSATGSGRTSGPERFFVPPYVGGRGWLGVRLDVPDIDWDEIEELLADAYRQVAPRRLVAEARVERHEPTVDVAQERALGGHGHGRALGLPRRDAAHL